MLSHSTLFIFVGGDDNVDILDNSQEVLIHSFAIYLKLENGSVNFVDHENWSDHLTKSLSQDSFGLHSDTLDVVDDDKGTISDSKGSSDL